MAYEFSPEFLELAGKYAAGLATEEEAAKFKAMRSEIRKDLRPAKVLTVDAVRAKLQARITALEVQIAYLDEHGCLPPKEVKEVDPNAPAKKRGRPRKIEAISAE